MNNWLGRIADHRKPNSIAGRLRQRRMRRFLTVLRKLPKPVSILDVGGTEEFWKFSGLAGDADYRITLLNISSPSVSHANIASARGDARKLRYDDGAFDVVFSNSVIEHVGTAADQHAMASEVRRVGKAYFVQTPNRYFPIEPHFLFPFFQFLPRGVRLAMVRRFAMGWYPRATNDEEAQSLVDEIRLLDEKELRTMFPEARIWRERFLAMTKSLVAYEGFGES